MCSHPSCAHWAGTASKSKNREALKDELPESEELAGESRAHLAGVACAVFWDVTVIHRISAHNSQEFHLQQQH